MNAAPPPGASAPSAPPSARALRGRLNLEPAEAAIFETFVVPRYTALFGELALDMLAESEDAQVVHLHCRTGYPDRGLVAKLRGAYLVGVDTSVAALELARAKAAAIPDLVSQYRQAAEFPTPLPAAAFSHALTLHPLGDLDDRGEVLGECTRLLASDGQVILAMPLRGSFQEVADLLREYALKHDDEIVGHAVETAALSRPTIESLGVELEEAGFDFVDLSSRSEMLHFQSGREFFEDPIARLILLPELQFELGLADGHPALAYVRGAIDKYWSDGSFGLTVNVGCATGRKI